MKRQLPRGMFGTEAELCQVLVALARAGGYQVHSEVGNWDLLLVARDTGLQIGVHAKLRPSVDVLAQAIDNLEGEPGPDVHAVLVPVATRAFCRVAAALRIRVLQGVRLTDTSSSYEFKKTFVYGDRWKHPTRHWVPEVEVIAPAGVPSPKRITPWKLAACKLCLRARERGFVTAADMRELKLNRHWWFEPRFGPILVARARGEYVLRDPLDARTPDLRWPEIVVALQPTGVRKGPRLRVRRTDSLRDTGKTASVT